MKTKKDCSVGGKENGGRRGSQRRERNRSTQQPFEDSEPQNAICRGLPRVPPVPGLRAFVTRPGELQHVPAQTHGAAWLQNPCSGTQRAMETKRSIFTSSCCRNKLLGGLMTTQTSSLRVLAARGLQWVGRAGSSCRLWGRIHALAFSSPRAAHRPWLAAPSSRPSDLCLCCHTSFLVGTLVMTLGPSRESRVTFPSPDP